MKRYSLLLFILSLATLQASQQSDLNLNNNNKNEQSESSSTYVHGDLTNWQKWIKDVKYKDLRKPLMDLYSNGVSRSTAHIKKRLPVHFVIGPTGSGKSTFIFALQGNKVIKKQQKRTRRKTSNNKSNKEEVGKSNNNYNNTGQLILTNTVNIPTPEIAHTTRYGVTKGVKIHYTGKDIEKTMAFCDTEGFLATREDKISNAEKLVSAFASHFVLQANPIGGIIFLLSSGDITTNRGETFFSFMNSLTNYFDLTKVKENRKVLKQSVMLLINKADSQEDNAFRSLARFIKDSYKTYYQAGIKQNKNNEHNTYQQSNNKQEQLNQLKPFFSLFLKNDINEDTIKNKIDKYTNDLKKLNKIQDKQIIEQHEEDIINFFDERIDEDKVCCFYPDDKDEVEKTRHALSQLTALDYSTCLYLQENPISQYLIREITHRSYVINKRVQQALFFKNQVQLHKLILQKNNDDALQKLSSQFKQRQKQLKGQNETMLRNKTIKSVDTSHIQDISLEKQNKEISKLAGGVLGVVVGGVVGVVGGVLRGGVRGVLRGVLRGVEVGEVGGVVGGEVGVVVGGVVGGVVGVVGGVVVGGVVGGVRGGVRGGKVGGKVGGVVGGVVGGKVGRFLVKQGIISDSYDSYLNKNFIYTGEAPIYRIVVKEENSGSITWQKPSKDFIARNFNRTIQGTTTTLISKDEKGIKQDKWHIVHRSACEQNARCFIQFFSTKNHLQESQWKVEDNKNKIQRIDNLLKKLETFKKTNKDKLEKDHVKNQEVANKHIKELCKLQEEIKMINCWSTHIFKKDSANQELIEQYRHNYNEAVPDKYQISIQDNNNYNNIISSYQDNTNSKHSDNKSSLEPKNTMEEDDDNDNEITPLLNDTKGKHGNNKIEPQLKNTIEDEEEQKEDDENNNSSSISSVPLTVTAILAGLLKTKN